MMSTSASTSDEVMVSEYSDESESDDAPFLEWIHTLSANRYMIRVDLDYFRDGFNRVGIHKFMNLTEAEAFHVYKLIIQDADLLSRAKDPDGSLVDTAIDFYGLIHSRYIQTPDGLDEMKERYLNASYGTCPRHYCGGQHCLPVGESAELNTSLLKKYCPKCQDIYEMKFKVDLDGAFFGPYFPSAFLMAYPYLIPKQSIQKQTPRLFGFKIHQSDDQGNDSNSNMILG